MVRKAEDGSKQRTYYVYKTSDKLSPMVVTEIIFVTWVVGAHEGRHVAALDTENTFLCANSSKNTTMLLRKKL